MAAQLQAFRHLRKSTIAIVALAGSAMATIAHAQVVLLPAVNTTNGASEAHAINDSGRVVGQTTASNPGPPRSAAQWIGTTQSVLPSLAGAPSGGQQGNVAFGINNNGVATDLGNVPGASVTQARAINNAGEIAGSGIGSNLTAVRWTPSGTQQTLALLPTHENSFAWAINASSQISGFAVTDAGVPAFILTIPTPGAAGLSALGGLLPEHRR